jgi:hypothetical protein
MTPQSDAPGGDKGVVQTTLTGDLGHDDPLSHPTGHHDAQPGFDRSHHVPVPGGLPLSTPTPTGDFGHDDPLSRSTRHHDAQPGLEPDPDVPFPAGLPLPERRTP